MRILLIQERGRHEKNQEFRETLCLMRGFQKAGVHAEVRGLNYPDPGKPLAEYANEFDVVFLLENYDQTGWVPNLSACKAFKIFWSIDSHCNLGEHLRTVDSMKPDLLLGSIESDLGKFPVRNRLYFPNAYPDELISYMPGINKSLDIGFCGNPGSGERHGYVNMLASHYGPRFRFDNFVIGRDMVEAINSYRIQFNRNLANDINYRTFETLGCKTLLITNETENLNKHFTVGKHLLTYSDPNSLVETINFALVNGNWAEEIAREGYEHVQKNHTYAVRCGWLLEELRRLI